MKITARTVLDSVSQRLLSSMYLLKKTLSIGIQLNNGNIRKLGQIGTLGPI